MVVLSEKQGVLLVHLVVWLLAIISGTLLSLRFFAIWHRRLALKVDIGFLIASWVSYLTVGGRKGPRRGGAQRAATTSGTFP